MKKTILGIMLTIALVMAMVGTVNAASLSVDKNKINAGDKVVVTITAKDAFENIDFTMSYDSTKFEYVSVSDEIGMVDANAETANEVVVSGAGKATKTISLTFKALKDVEAGDATFSIKDTTLTEAFETNKDKVTVSIAKSAKPNTNKDDEPKTGMSIVAGIVPVLVLAGAVLVIKKTK